MQGDLQLGRDMATSARHRLITNLREDTSALNGQVTELKADVAEFVKLGDVRLVDDRSAQAAQLDARIAECAPLERDTVA